MAIDIKREIVKKNVFLAVAIVSGMVLIAGLSFTIMGDASPIKFVVNNSPVKVVVLPFLVFCISFVLYRNSKKAIEENRK